MGRIFKPPENKFKEIEPLITTKLRFFNPDVQYFDVTFANHRYWTWKDEIS